MAQDSADDDYIDWNTDDDLEVDNKIDSFRSSSSSSVHPTVEALAVPAPRTSSLSSPDETETTCDLVQIGFSDKMFATLVDMGYSVEDAAKAIEENGPNADVLVIIDTISKYSSNCEAGSSKSKVIDHFLGMGYDEEKVIKVIHEHGEENEEQILNALLSCGGEEISPIVKEEEDSDIDWTSSDDELKFPDTLISDDENDASSSSENGNKIKSLVKMGFSQLEASLAIERCGETVSLAELTDFICAAQMARQFSEFDTDPEEQKPKHDAKKRRTELKRAPRSSTDDEPVRLPNPMIGFGLPNEPGLIQHRSLPEEACVPPYFYYENVALAPKGVWETISRHLYDIAPEFVDSKYICAAARKRGYIHNLPISNRFMLQPPPKYTISEAFPLTKKWWPSWDKRTKLNCILTVTASAQLTNRIRGLLEPYNGDPPLYVQQKVMEQCRKWNLVWVGKNKAAPLEPDEMENILGFPRNHTRGGGMSRTERLKSLGNSFQVDTVAYHLSVLKSMFPGGINVLSLFTGIGGGEVALHRLQVPMKTVVSVEISEVNRNILKDFWEQTNQKGTLIEFADVEHMTNNKIEEMMERFGGFDLVIGGSPCNNLAGGNRVSRSGLEGAQSSLFFEYCRILEVVRHKTASMRRRR